MLLLLVVRQPREAPLSGLYRIRSILGQGATAVVVAAERVGDPGRGVALKVLRADLRADPRMAARAVDEAAVLRQLVHPNLLHVHRLLEYRGRLVIESELVDGVGLDRALRKGALEPADALALTREVAIGLEAAYGSPSPVDGRPLHVVHRDLKPANVLLTRDGGVKVVDFGMASSRLTPLDAGLRGTPGFSAPEPLTGADLPAVDVYALGLTLFTTLVGCPLVLSRERERHDAQVAEALTRLARFDLPTGVGPLLSALLQQMLAHPAEDRPSLQEVVVQLSRLTAHPALEADLPALARLRVPDRSLHVPCEQEAWPDVCFLEEDLPDPPPSVRPAAEVEVEVRQRLQEPDWMDDLPGLRRLLASADGPVETPFLDLLTRNGWRFWRRKIPGREREGALLLLAVHPSERAQRRARALLDSSDARVVAAARRVLVGL